MITAVSAILLVLVCLAPLALGLWRGRVGRDRREAALALHRAQLAELDRDLADGRLAPSEHAAAQLEVQRRLLAAAELAPQAVEVAPRAGRRALALAVPFVVPILAAALYLIHGQPGMPAMPLAMRIKAEQAARTADAAKLEMLIATLRRQLPTLDPHSEKARQGYVLLGNVEESRGNLDAAAEAWRKALDIRFDPGLAAMAAEARTLVDGGMVDADSAHLFARALAEGPKDAPWRETALQRLAQTGLARTGPDQGDVGQGDVGKSGLR
jgi:cytochrome c-type biogenesis protein CcmH